MYCTDFENLCEVKDGETPPYASAPEIPFPPQLMPGAFDSVDLRLEGDGCTWHRPTTLAGVLALKSSHPQAQTLKSLCVGALMVCVSRRVYGRVKEKGC